MVLAVDRLLVDFMSKQSNSLFICHRATSESNYKVKPIDLLDELLQFVSSNSTMAPVITAADYKEPSSRNHLLIADGYDSFL